MATNIFIKNSGKIKTYLKEDKNFADTKGNSIAMISPSGVQVDILPFGEIEIDDSVAVAGGALDIIKVNGFKEVYLLVTISSPF